jgi:hypothetical protein
MANGIVPQGSNILQEEKIFTPGFPGWHKATSIAGRTEFSSPCRWKRSVNPELSVGREDRPVAELPAPGAAEPLMRDAKAGFFTKQKSLGVAGTTFIL